MEFNSINNHLNNNSHHKPTNPLVDSNQLQPPLKTKFRMHSQSKLTTTKLLLNPNNNNHCNKNNTNNKQHLFLPTNSKSHNKIPHSTKLNNRINKHSTQTQLNQISDKS